MEKLWKLIQEFAPVLGSYPKWAQGLFTITFLLCCISLSLFVLMLPSANARLRASQQQPSTEPHPTVTIEGPPSVPLGKTTYFTVLTRNAVRGVWSAGGFTDAPIEVSPLPPSFQIFIEPTNADRVGQEFVIVFDAYNASGSHGTGTKRFRVVAN